MPATEDGTNRLLDFFVYGMLRAAESLGNAPLFMRTVVEQGLRKFMLVNLPTFRESDNATEACEAFTKARMPPASSTGVTACSEATRTRSMPRSAIGAPIAACARSGTTKGFQSTASARSCSPRCSGSDSMPTSIGS